MTKESTAFNIQPKAGQGSNVQTIQQLLQTDVAGKIAEKFSKHPDLVYKPEVIKEYFKILQNYQGGYCNEIDGTYIDEQVAKVLLEVCNIHDHDKFIRKLYVTNRDAFTFYDYDAFEDKNMHPLCDKDGQCKGLDPIKEYIKYSIAPNPESLQIEPKIRAKIELYGEYFKTTFTGKHLEFFRDFPYREEIKNGITFSYFGDVEAVSIDQPNYTYDTFTTRDLDRDTGSDKISRSLFNIQENLQYQQFLKQAGKKPFASEEEYLKKNFSVLQVIADHMYKKGLLYEKVSINLSFLQNDDNRGLAKYIVRGYSTLTGKKFNLGYDNDRFFLMCNRDCVGIFPKYTHGKFDLSFVI